MREWKVLMFPTATVLERIDQSRSEQATVAGQVRKENSINTGRAYQFRMLV